jgi:hypothetical protein
MLNPWDQRVRGIVAAIRMDAVKAHSTEIGLLSQSIGPIKARIAGAGSGSGVCAALACW